MNNKYFCKFLDFGLSTEMTVGVGSLQRNIMSAKDDFQHFLQSMFRVFELDSNWSWLGLNAADSNRMQNKDTFIEGLLKDAVSL